VAPIAGVLPRRLARAIPGIKELLPANCDKTGDDGGAGAKVGRNV